MPFNKQLFSTALHARLLQDNLSIREAAKASGVGVSTVSRFINGNTPDIENFALLILWLKVDANVFLDNTPQEDDETDAWIKLYASLLDLGMSMDLAEAIVKLVQVMRKGVNTNV